MPVKAIRKKTTHGAGVAGMPGADADAGLITGLVVGAADEAPRGGIIVKLAGTGRIARPNADGRFQFADLEPGTYTVMFETEDGTDLGSVEEEAAAGEQTFVRFVVGG